MRNCTYTIEGSKRPYTYEELVDYFYRNGDKDTVDFLYELADSKLEDIKDRLLKLKKEYNLRALLNSVGDIDFTLDEVNNSTVWTTQTLIDSGKFVDLRGHQIVTPLKVKDFIKHYIALNRDEIGEEAAAIKARETVNNWPKIAEDGILMHQFLSDGFDEQLSKAREATKGTVYEDIYEKIYDLTEGAESVFRKPKGVFSGFAPGTCKVVRNLNLRCKLVGTDEDLIGHIDNLIIDNLGGLHIVNYKVTTTGLDPDKEKKYKYQLALLKLMLANAGFNTEHMTLSIIPIRLQYNDDFSKITDVIAMDKIEYTMKNGQYNFSKEDSVVKRFVASTATIRAIDSDKIDLANKQIKALWPDKNITVNGIKLTVDEWISTYKHKIIPVNDKPGVFWKVDISDEVPPLEISDPSRPQYNEELKRKLAENYEQLKVGNSYVGSHEILRKIRADFDKKGITSFSNEKGFSSCGKYFDKLFFPYMEKFGDDLIWEVIENDLLTNENIILFRNKVTGQLDVITISPLNLDVIATFRGGYNNILGLYIGDTEAMNKKILKADYGNIEAFRTMFILNLVLNDIEGSYNLGSLQIISPENIGHSRIYPMQDIVKDFSVALQVINKNNQDIDVKNNFAGKPFQDTLDVFIQMKDAALKEGIISASDRVSLSDWGMAVLEEPNSKEVKQNALRNLVKSMEITWKLPVNAKALDAFSALNPENRIKVQLYKYAQKAMLAYDGINLDLNENDMSSVDYYMQGAPYIPSRNASVVTSLFQRTIDKIAENAYKDSRPVLHYLLEFYDAAGYSNTLNSIIGNQTSQFNNLYAEVDGKRTMYFKNPYTDVTLKPHEAKLLKQALFTLAKIRARMFPNIKFDFANYADPDLKDWIEENQWYLEVPLTKASKSSKRVSGYAWQDFKYRMNNILSKSGQILNFQELFENITSEELKEQLQQDISRMSITNPFALYDSKNSYGGVAARASMLNRHDPKFFESNLETLLINMIEAQYQAEEMGTFLLQSKAILTTLSMLGDVGTPRLQNTVKYITDYVTVNSFNKSIMEESSKRIMNAVIPGRHLATTLYIAGNLVSGVRDLTEGLLQNMTRSVIKYLTNISSKNLGKAYAEVVKNSFTNVRSINMLNLLNAFYRISNVDVARIQEVLATGRSGVVNYENWLYATMRRPDFINRMTLFVARMMEDGVWEAYSLNEDGDLEYNWKEDKRFSIYASGDAKNSEYLKQKGAYFSAIMEYNREHPEAPLDPRKDDLPRPYSFEQVESIKTVANSIYGGYDKSVKAMYEHVALGIALGQFTTWMNGMVGNYFRKPGTKTGQYELVLSTNVLGELEFLDPVTLSIVVQKTREDGSTYFYDESLGQEVTGEFVPFFKNVPILGLGIIYTVFKSAPKALKVGFERGGLMEAFREFEKEIWNNPEERKNLKKLLSDIAMWMFMALLFKYAITPAYKEYKKDRDKENLLGNAFVDIMYGGWSKSYDGFRGAYNVVDTLGNNMNPPAYKAPVNLATNIAKFPFDEDKTFGQLLTQNAPMLRSFNTAYNQYVK